MLPARWCIFVSPRCHAYKSLFQMNPKTCSTSKHKYEKPLSSFVYFTTPYSGFDFPHTFSLESKAIAKIRIFVYLSRSQNHFVAWKHGKKGGGKKEKWFLFLFQKVSSADKRKISQFKIWGHARGSYVVHADEKFLKENFTTIYRICTQKPRSNANVLIIKTYSNLYTTSPFFNRSSHCNVTTIGVQSNFFVLQEFFPFVYDIGCKAFILYLSRLRNSKVPRF